MKGQAVFTSGVFPRLYPFIVNQQNELLKPVKITLELQTSMPALTRKDLRALEILERNILRPQQRLSHAYTHVHPAWSKDQARSGIG
jgi:hypothetical protein